MASAETRPGPAGFWRQFVPDAGLPRNLFGQTLLFSFAAGITLAGNVVFFVRYLGLGATQVSLGLTVAMALSTVTSLHLGRVIDLVGARRIWFTAAVLEGLTYLLYPVARNVVVFVVLQSILQIATGTGNSARTVYSYAVVSGPSRVRNLALFRSAFNFGLTFGGLLALGLMLPGTRSLLVLLPLSASALFFINSFYIFRLPAEKTKPRDRKGFGVSLGALRNHAFVRFVLAHGVIGTHQTVLNVVLPLWIVERAGAPQWMIPCVVAVNTIMVIVAQAPLSRRADTLPGALRLTARSGWSAAVACLLLAATPLHGSLLVSAVIVVVAILLTTTEVWQSAGVWGWFPAFARPEERGEYQSVLRLAGQIPLFVAPVALTALAIHGGALGWGAIAVVYGLSAAAARPLGLRVPIRHEDEHEAGS